MSTNGCKYVWRRSSWLFSHHRFVIDVKRCIISTKDRSGPDSLPARSYCFRVVFFFLPSVEVHVCIQSFKKNNKRFAFVSFKLENNSARTVCFFFPPVIFVVKSQCVLCKLQFPCHFQSGSSADKSRYSAGVCLATPLQSIKGKREEMKFKCFTGPCVKSEYVHTKEKNLQNWSGILNFHLDFPISEGGSAELNCSDFGCLRA